MHPSGASRNKEDHAIFSNEGPNLIRPALTNKPRVIPKKYKPMVILLQHFEKILVISQLDSKYSLEVQVKIMKTKQYSQKLVHTLTIQMKQKVQG